MGASAGGIKAFKQFFERVPADSGMAYVVILHLSPKHDSKLAEILQVSAAIPVAIAWPHMEGERQAAKAAKLGLSGLGPLQDAVSCIPPYTLYGSCMSTSIS